MKRRNRKATTARKVAGKKNKTKVQSSIPADTSEADIEARVHGALLDCFPHLASTDLEHQRSFSVRIGRSTIEIGRGAQATARGRLDILVNYRGKHLAILEIKAPQVALSDDDRDQVISYARLTHPMTPLAVVTNGTETQIFETYSSHKLSAEHIDAKQLSSLVNATALVAESDRDSAVATLLGVDPDMWRQIMEQHTDRAVADMTGNWDSFQAPFVTDFLVPRKAAERILARLSKNARLVVLTGPPMSGKSNVARDLVELARRREAGLCLLYIDGASCQQGVIQTIANLLAGEMFLQPNPDAVRAWLLRLMRASIAPKLVILVDNVPPGHSAKFHEDLGALFDMMTGSSVAMVLATGEYSAERLCFVHGRRQKTKLGRAANVVRLNQLDDEEFAHALDLLRDQKKVRFWDGVEFNNELRWPRYLRTIAAMAASSDQYDIALGRDHGLMLPSVTGPSIVLQCREHWKHAHGVRSSYQRIAKIMVQEARDGSDLGTASPGLALRRLAIGAVSEGGLRREFGAHELDALQDAGHIKFVDGPDGSLLGVPGLPEMVTSEASYLIAQELNRSLASVPIAEAAVGLARETSRLPMGDILGACVLYDMAHSCGSVPVALVQELIAMPPELGECGDGLQMRMYDAGCGDISLSVGGGAIHVTTEAGSIGEATMDSGDRPVVVRSLHPYLVLSQIAGLPMALIGPSGSQGDQFALNFRILAAVGSCGVVLARPCVSSLGNMRGVLVHNLGERGEVICHHNGIIEPITAALIVIGMQCHEVLSELTQLSCIEDRLPLVSRLYAATGQMIDDPREDVSQFALALREEALIPKLRQFNLYH